MKIEIQGQDAVNATEELLRIEGLQGSYETVSEAEREVILDVSLVAYAQHYF